MARSVLALPDRFSCKPGETRLIPLASDRGRTYSLNFYLLLAEIEHDFSPISVEAIRFGRASKA
jgi:hypothetical protein